MPAPSNSGIVTDADGRRVIPESRRPDGSIRPAIKVRPGYLPPEDVPKYQIPLYRRKAVVGAADAEAKAKATVPESPAPVTTAARLVAKTVPGAVPGASSPAEAEPVVPAASSTAAKNAKRREARKKAAAANSAAEPSETKAEGKAEVKANTKAAAAAPPAAMVEPAAAPSSTTEDRDKKIRGLKKKLKQARELQTKSEGGESLLPEQLAKVIRISELTRELEALGLGDGAEEKEK